MDKPLTKKEILQKYGVEFEGQCFSYGNRKLPENHLIINFCSSQNCPSKARGYCRVKRCYAAKCEKLRLAYLNKNLKMEQFFKNIIESTSCYESFRDAYSLVRIYIAMSPKKITHIRFNEAGDFPSDDYVDLAKFIASCAKNEFGIISYAWSARKDLNFGNRNFLLNASLPEMQDCDNHFYCTKRKDFDTITEIPGNVAKCIGDCSSCSICHELKGYTVYCKEH